MAFQLMFSSHIRANDFHRLSTDPTFGSHLMTRRLQPEGGGIVKVAGLLVGNAEKYLTCLFPAKSIYQAGASWWDNRISNEIFERFTN